MNTTETMTDAQKIERLERRLESQEKAIHLLARQLVGASGIGLEVDYVLEGGR